MTTYDWPSRTPDHRGRQLLADGAQRHVDDGRVQEHDPGPEHDRDQGPGSPAHRFSLAAASRVRTERSGVPAAADDVLHAGQLVLAQRVALSSSSGESRRQSMQTKATSGSALADQLDAMREQRRAQRHVTPTVGQLLRSMRPILGRAAPARSARPADLRADGSRRRPHDERAAASVRRRCRPHAQSSMPSSRPIGAGHRLRIEIGHATATASRSAADTSRRSRPPGATSAASRPLPAAVADRWRRAAAIPTGSGR